MAQSKKFSYKTLYLSLNNYKKYNIQNWSQKNFHTCVPLKNFF